MDKFPPPPPKKKEASLDDQHFQTPGHVAQLVASPTANPEFESSIPCHTFVEIAHEIISMVILLLQLIQEGMLSVTSKKAQSTALSQACPGKSVVRWTDCPDMTIAVDWDVKNKKSIHCMINHCTVF